MKRIKTKSRNFNKLFLKFQSKQATHVLCRIYYCCNLMRSSRAAIWDEFERTYNEIYPNHLKK